MVGDMAVSDALLVAEHAVGHKLLGCALVLDQEVDVGVVCCAGMLGLVI